MAGYLTLDLPACLGEEDTACLPVLTFKIRLAVAVLEVLFKVQRHILAKLKVNRGSAYFDLGEKEKAIEDFTRAVQIDPKLAMAYSNRGSAYFDLGQKEKAIRDFTQAIQIDPKYANAYFNRGTAYSELGEKEKAVEDYTQAIQIDPKYTDAYFNRGYVYGELGEKDLGIMDFQKCVELTANPELRMFAEEKIKELTQLK